MATVVLCVFALGGRIVDTLSGGSYVSNMDNKRLAAVKHLATPCYFQLLKRRVFTTDLN